MSIQRLQLTLIPDLRPAGQPLPAAARHESVELVARMIVHLIRGEQKATASKEVRHESR